MRSSFRGYYPPTNDELDALWGNGLIILDTNALLNLFRYTKGTRDEFLNVLASFGDFLWIPHQVGLEFHRNRLEVIQQQEKAFDEIDSALNSATKGVTVLLKKFDRHPSLDAAVLAKKLEESHAEIVSLLDDARSQHVRAILDPGENDVTFAAVSDLYEGRIGLPFDSVRLASVYAAGAGRYDNRIPPGYKDAAKPEPDRYGDLVLWEQILEKVRADPRPAIFVTDDSKEDWWFKANGKTIGPRVELVEEYFNASGERVHFYAPDRFLNYAKERRGKKVSQASLSEVEKVSSARPESQLEIDEFSELLFHQTYLGEERDRLQLSLNALLRHGAGADHAEARLREEFDEILRLQRQVRVMELEIGKLELALTEDMNEGVHRTDQLERLRTLSAERDLLYGAIEQGFLSYSRLNGSTATEENVNEMHLVASLRDQLARVESDLRAVSSRRQDLQHSRNDDEYRHSRKRKFP